MATQPVLSRHNSAKPSHYNKASKKYDAFNEENSRTINQTVESILKKYGAKTVLDLTCGTGSQVFWLAQRGYEVTGADINSNMLKIARSKARAEKSHVKLLKGDMRTIKVGAFDAVITIFNAIGHLTKPDFEKAIKNIHGNLKNEGLYVFDINNLTYLMEGDHITDLTIDWQKTIDAVKVRTIQYSTIDTDGVLASYTTCYFQKNFDKPKIFKSAQTLQVYTAHHLKEMLRRNGFEVLAQCGIDGTELNEYKTDRILTVAQKQESKSC